MRRLRVHGTLGVLSALAAAAAFVASIGTAVPAAAGQAGATGPADLYKTECQPCHGEGGKGDGPAARFMDTKPRDLTSDAWMYAIDRSVEQVIEVVTNGVDDTGMEPFGEILTEEEIRAVASYVVENFVSDGSEPR